MTANKLTINAAKTHAMVFSPNINNSNENISLSGNGCPITIQKTVKYLGFPIDNKLDFPQHIKAIEKKVACATGIVCKLKYYLPKDILLQLYHALIYSHLTSAIPVWGASYKTYLRKIVTSQNKVVKKT